MEQMRIWLGKTALDELCEFINSDRLIHIELYIHIYIHTEIQI